MWIFYQNCTHTQMETAVAENKTSIMSLNKSLSRTHTSFFISQCLLRILAIIFTVVAISVMVTSAQTVVIFGFPYEARYNYTSANRFLFLVDILVCALSALSLVLGCFLKRRGSYPRNYFSLFLHDLVIMTLMMSGCAAVSAVGYVAQHGEDRAGWGAVCKRVVRFCNRMLVSVTLSYLAFIVYLVLTVMATRKLMSLAK